MDEYGHSSLALEQITKTVQSLTKSKRLWVGFSGGLDSHVLLDVLVRAFAMLPDYTIGAIHVHHGISEYADHWVQHCGSICTDLKIPLMVLRVDGRVVDGRSPEEVAREARYTAFENFLQKEDCLLLAHHGSDQAETILLRLFRGSGPLGLSGMQNKTTLGVSELIRPLLLIQKAELIQYAEDRQLQWIEDESNSNMRFDRNFLRHEILPLLSARWPHVTRSINRAGILCYETAAAVQILAQDDLNDVKGEVQHVLSVSRLLKLEPIRRWGALRCWFRDLGFSFPSRDHMIRIDREVLNAQPGAKPRLKISNFEVRRVRDELSANPI